VIDAGLFSLLSSSPAITAICPGTSIYPVVLPTGPSYPCMLYKLMSAKPSPTLDTSGFQRCRVEFDCFSQTYAQAVSLRAAIRSTLEGYRGALNDGTLLQDAQFIQILDDYENDARIFRAMIEMYLFFDFQ